MTLGIHNSSYECWLCQGNRDLRASIEEMKVNKDCTDCTAKKMDSVESWFKYHPDREKSRLTGIGPLIRNRRMSKCLWPVLLAPR